MGEWSHIQTGPTSLPWMIFSQVNDDFIIPQLGDEVEPVWFFCVWSSLIGNTIVMTNRKENVFDVLHYGNSILSERRQRDNCTCWTHNLCVGRDCFQIISVLSIYVLAPLSMIVQAFALWCGCCCFWRAFTHLGRSAVLSFILEFL